MTCARPPLRRARLLALCAVLSLDGDCAAALFAQLPTGEWQHTDLRWIEVLPDTTCVRVWFEERTYSLESATDGRLAGAYRNVVRAMPAAFTSFARTCTYPAPAENPVAHQIRMWLVVGTKDGRRAGKCVRNLRLEAGTSTR